MNQKQKVFCILLILFKISKNNFIFYHKCNRHELEYYQKLIDNKKQKDKADNKNSSILMIIPVKQRIPYIKPWVSFDFEVAVLDFRY